MNRAGRLMVPLTVTLSNTTAPSGCQVAWVAEPTPRNCTGWRVLPVIVELRIEALPLKTKKLRCPEPAVAVLPLLAKEVPSKLMSVLLRVLEPVGLKP